MSLSRKAACVLASALCVLMLAPSGAARDAKSTARDAKQTEARLEAIRAEIARISAEAKRDQRKEDRLTKELRAAELSVAKARASLDAVRDQRAEHAAKRAALAEEKREREAQLVRERSSLASQLRAAYLIGREEPLKLLLNQRDPTRVGRMFAYYSYFGRARAEQISRISENLARLEELDRELAAEDERLAALEAQRASELQRLEEARAGRSKVLESLHAEAKSRARSLARLKREQSGLEKLLRELKRALERFPEDTDTQFGRLRGKLAWPVTGKIVARFGDDRAGGVKWDGVLIATERGVPVRAVSRGRVVYADWLPGLGLLAIIDHGDGYLSLYGHNDQLYKAAGERVEAGEPIAAAGDSGGLSRPELYFEIRKRGRPIDPQPWFRSSAPLP